MFTEGMAPMTEYELMRERNIANNRATLASLGLDKQLFAPPDKSTSKNSVKPRKRKLSEAGDTAPENLRRSTRRKTRASSGDDPNEDYKHQSLDESDYDEDKDLVDVKPKRARRELLSELATERRYREPVIQASGNYRVICIRHPDGTYEEPDAGIRRGPEEQDVPLALSPEKIKALSKENSDLAKAKIFGHQPRVPIGRWYPGRRGFHDALVHRGLVNGIFGDEDEGAYSVSVSGGYEDDVDEGYKFVFTGEGGRHLRVDPKTGQAKNLRTAPQTRAQGMKKGNLALKKSCETGRPVRVIRGYKGRSVWAPTEGYRYDGLYQVLKVWEDTGLSGFPVFRFAFVRLPDQPPIDILAGPGSWTKEQVEELQAKDEVKRVASTPKKTKKSQEDEDGEEEEGDLEPKQEEAAGEEAGNANETGLDQEKANGQGGNGEQTDGSSENEAAVHGKPIIGDELCE